MARFRHAAELVLVVLVAVTIDRLTTRRPQPEPEPPELSEPPEVDRQVLDSA